MGDKKLKKGKKATNKIGRKEKKTSERFDLRSYFLKCSETVSYNIGMTEVNGTSFCNFKCELIVTCKPNKEVFIIKTK